MNGVDDEGGDEEEESHRNHETHSHEMERGEQGHDEYRQGQDLELKNEEK